MHLKHGDLCFDLSAAHVQEDLVQFVALRSFKSERKASRPSAGVCSPACVTQSLHIKHPQTFYPQSLELSLVLTRHRAAGEEKTKRKVFNVQASSCSPSPPDLAEPSGKVLVLRHTTTTTTAPPPQHHLWWRAALQGQEHRGEVIKTPPGLTHMCSVWLYKDWK